MPRRHDEQSLQRRRPSREPKIRILVVCEGKKTEPLYLRQLQHHVRNPRVHVEAVGPAGVPRTVVGTAIDPRGQAADEARRQRDENLLWDEVWAVFDVDDHPNVAEAKQLATANGIHLAVSNPCYSSTCRATTRSSCSSDSTRATRRPFGAPASSTTRPTGQGARVVTRPPASTC
jgi:RloB-like protein